MPKFIAPTNPEISPSEQAHMDLSRALAGECVVLLENDGTLPVKEPCRLALFGAGARLTVKGGTGSGDVNSRFAVSIEEGLEQAGFEIATKNWIERRSETMAKAKQAHRDFVNKVSMEQGIPTILVEFGNPFKEPALDPILEEDITGSGTDLAFYVISRNSGEGADRSAVKGDYYLADEEKEQLELLAKAYDKLVVVLNIGGVMDLSGIKAIDGINSIILMSQLGNIGGLAFADVVTGKVNPSGKLADTWAKKYEDYPSSATFSHNNGDIDDDNYLEGIYVGYRWFDTAKVEPLYPFGYGKSYTTFTSEPAGIKLEDGFVHVTETITNTGSEFAGKEVAEVYVSAPCGKLHKPYQELKGYAKSPLLAPGASAEVTVRFPLAVCASYSEEEAAWILEKGDYIIRVGNSSDNTKPAGIIRLDADAVTVKTRNLFAHDNEYEELVPENENKAVLPADLPVIEVKASDIPTDTCVYSVREEYKTDKTRKLTLRDVMEGSCTVEELVAQLTVEEMATLCVGTQRQGEDGANDSIIGNASQALPGAAGDTSPVVRDRGIRSLSMADGPAGLRLQPHFKARHDGTLLPGGAVFGDAFIPFPEYDNPEDVVDYYQYATAIPIGWALAQSWNYDLVQQAAEMVGSEMETFGCDIWLAPAMNIHRNPLCGRNFEYYSEDPVIAGRTAAAIVNGVQSHKGRGVSIKHFAANNQEDARYTTNAHVSERALREIYLRNFEICIRDSDPMTIMTSYNLINGIHAANSIDLLQYAARDEWGFKGCIMTDWFSTAGLGGLGAAETKYPWGSDVGAIYAGNDIQMPGGSQIVQHIVEAVENGAEKDGFKITLADLQFNAANVIRAVLFAEEK